MLLRPFAHSRLVPVDPRNHAVLYERDHGASRQHLFLGLLVIGGLVVSGLVVSGLLWVNSGYLFHWELLDPGHHAVFHQRHHGSPRQQLFVGLLVVGRLLGIDPGNLFHSGYLSRSELFDPRNYAVFHECHYRNPR